MKLIKATNESKGLIWYFTTINKAAMYISTSPSNVNRVLGDEEKLVKGWKIEEIESDYILSKFINPERNKVIEDVNKEDMIYNILNMVSEILKAKH